MSEESVTTTTSDTSLASDASCAVCRSSKIERNCDLCDSEVCKKCLHFLAEGTFAFWAELPGELSFTHYCTTCHAEHVETALEKYRDLMEQAKEVAFCFDTQKRHLPLLSKAKNKVFVEDCPDRDETILRLAFQAVEQGFSGIVDATVICKKVRNEGYQKSSWSGAGLPAKIDLERIYRTNQEI
jgi:hypothetical protein